jgi:hypothetical protein
LIACMDAITPVVEPNTFTTRFKRWLYKWPVLRMAVADRNCRFVALEPPSVDGAPVVVIVHGTWAPRSDWTQDGSALLAQVRARLKGCGLARFQWSGLNGLRPRLKAADRLASEINEKLNGVPVVAIGHSHGGNIIAWAATQVNTPLRRSVYMNTPFIQGRTPKNHFFAQIVLWVTIVVLVGGNYIWNPPAGLEPHWLLLSLLLFLWGANRLSMWLTRGLPTTVSKLEAVSLNERRIQSELSVCSTGDEIGTLFALTFGSQWLLNRVFMWGGIVFLVGLPVGTAAYEFDWPGKLVGGLVVFGILASIVVATAWTFVLNIGSYGLEHGLISLDADVTATPAPRGQVDIFTVPWPTEGLTRAGSRHSNVCEDMSVISHVSSWLEKACKPAK